MFHNILVGVQWFLKKYTYRESYKENRIKAGEVSQLTTFVKERGWKLAATASIQQQGLCAFKYEKLYTVSYRKLASHYV